MSAVEILKDLFFIERGYLNGNHFVYRSEEPILIDTAYASGFSQTEKLIRGLGVDLSKVKLIVNTHCHCDHVGGNKIIQDRSGCDVAMHRIGSISSALAMIGPHGGATMFRRRISSVAHNNWRKMK